MEGGGSGAERRFAWMMEADPEPVTAAAGQRRRLTSVWRSWRRKNKETSHFSEAVV